MSNNKLTVIHKKETWLNLTEKWLYNLVRYLPPDVESYILCKTKAHEEEFRLPNIHLLDSFHNINSLKGSIIHSHFGFEGWNNLSLVKELNSKHVVSFYGWDVNQLPNMDPIWTSHYNELFSQVDTILCEGEYMAETINRKLGCPKEKIKVHRLGIELEKIPFKPRIWKSDQTLKILLAGRFTEKKGFPIALETISEIKNHYKDIQVTIIGDMSWEIDRKEKERIIEKIKENGLIEKTRLLGFLPSSKLFEEAYDHHVFISPSIHAEDGNSEGGAPVTILEMAASGMPIISTNHCDIPGTLGKTNKEFLVSERNVEALTESFLKLLSLETWEPIVNENRKHLEENFCVRKQGYKLKEIYLNL